VTTRGWLRLLRRAGVTPLLLAAVIGQHARWFPAQRRKRFVDFLRAFGKARSLRQARDMFQPPESPHAPHLHEDDPKWVKWHEYNAHYTAAAVACMELLDAFVAPPVDEERAVGWYAKALRDLEDDPLAWWAKRVAAAASDAADRKAGGG